MNDRAGQHAGYRGGNNMSEALQNALTEADLARAADLLRAGADINARTTFGDSLLAEVIAVISDETERRAVVQFMLDHGADPGLLDQEGGGPLFAAVIAQDAEVVRLLLDRGADPNREHDMGEPLYDWAEFDFRYETFGLSLPETPTDADKASEDAWLQFLDRLAVEYGRRQPDYLVLLRERGALTHAEQQRLKTARAESR